MVSIFKIGISRNTKCDNLVGFPKSGHIKLYGFESFCIYFLNHYPDCFVSPLQVSGSDVESLLASTKDQLVASWIPLLSILYQEQPS